MNSEKYIGLDVHQATISVAVMAKTDGQRFRSPKPSRGMFFSDRTPPNEPRRKWFDLW